MFETNIQADKIERFGGLEALERFMGIYSESQSVEGLQDKWRMMTESDSWITFEFTSELSKIEVKFKA